MQNRKQYLKIVCGKVCSGKNAYLSLLPTDWLKIDVGDIVRELTKTQSRTHDKNLDSQIIDHLVEEIHYSRANTDTIVITGIRQLSIVKAIEEEIEGSCFELERILLDVPDNVLKARYIKRAAHKDAKISFEEAVKRDNLLGYSELEQYLRSVNTTIIANYNRNEIDTLQEK